MTTRTVLAVLALTGGCIDTVDEDPELAEQESAVVRQWVESTVMNVMTGKCFDIPNGSRLAGEPLNQYTCNGAPNQKFYIAWNSYGGFRIVSKVSGLCVTPAGYQGWSTQSMRLVQSTCQAGISDWAFDRFTELSYRTSRTGFRWQYDSAFCVDVPGGYRLDGLQLQAWPCHGGNNQTFTLTQAAY
jgi:hypothetical protein